MSIDFHRLVRPIDINQLIFIGYYGLNRLISDDRFSSIGPARIVFSMFGLSCFENEEYTLCLDFRVGETPQIV